MALIKSDDYLYTIIDDYCKNKYLSEKIIGFIDEVQKDKVIKYLDKLHFQNYDFFGGYSDAQRVLLVLSPFDWRIWDSPVKAVTVSYRKDVLLTHRDVLGSVLALGIQRDLIGDILLENGRAIIFTYPHISALILNELTMIARETVKVKLGFEEPLPEKNRFEDRIINIASMRLDCIISAITGLSREKSSECIKRGYIKHNNYQINENISFNNDDSFILSIRGYGKYLITNEISYTKRNRLNVLVKKYI